MTSVSIRPLGQADLDDAALEHGLGLDLVAEADADVHLDVGDDAALGLEEGEDRLVQQAKRDPVGRFVGDKAGDALNGLVSNDVLPLAKGPGIVWTALLTAQGKYLADFLIGRRRSSPPAYRAAHTTDPGRSRPEGTRRRNPHFAHADSR